MCGVIGIVGNKNVTQMLYDGLTMLQHRGQDAAGIVTWSEQGQFNLRKGKGLVRDVFREQHIKSLNGKSGIGHVRYPTAGTDSSAEAQPFYVNSPHGIILGHNGNLTNAKQLSQQLFVKERRHINTKSDSEVLLNVLADELSRHGLLSVESLFKAISNTCKRSEGAYAVVGMIANYGLFAFRDPNGLRPLVLGKRKNGGKFDQWMVASESVALDVSGFELVRDVEPGEALFIDLEGHLQSHKMVQVQTYKPCIFEYVYFARPDSIMDGISVYQARIVMGALLAKQIREKWPNLEIDVVMPVPDTSRTAALELANGLGVSYSEGFIKNRYIGRTFIMPGQKHRKNSVRQKLNTIDSVFKNKKVLIVDDSIVRGTTSQKIVKSAKLAGAKKVYFASASPPVRHQYVYGIDMPCPHELIGYNRTIPEIKQFIGADELFYQNLDELIVGINALNPQLDGLDASCFDGCYTTGTVTEAYLKTLMTERDKSAHKKPSEQKENIELYNSA